MTLKRESSFVDEGEKGRGACASQERAEEMNQKENSDAAEGK